MNKVLLTLWVLFTPLMFSPVAVAADLAGHHHEHKHVFVNPGAEKDFCSICGMHLAKFYNTNYIVDFNHKASTQVCSIHDVSAVLKQTPMSEVKSIQVVGIHSQQFIDSNHAFYVIGSSVKGTMSRVSKLAFADKVDALDFIAKNGGELAGFEQALASADDEFNVDNKMIVNKRSKMMYGKGEVIINTQCDANKLQALHEAHEHQADFNVGALKAALINDNICGNIRGKRLQMAALYYHDKVLTHQHGSTHNLHRALPKNEKCPVCGMFVYKYPHWATWLQVGEKVHYFDGVKDMIKFYLAPNKYGYDYKPSDYTHVVVLDYFTQESIDATHAFYVVGSNVNGPMGAEYIAFENKQDAYTFSVDHRGNGVFLFVDLLKSDALK